MPDLQREQGMNAAHRDWGEGEGFCLLVYFCRWMLDGCCHQAEMHPMDHWG